MLNLTGPSAQTREADIGDMVSNFGFRSSCHSLCSESAARQIRRIPPSCVESRR